MRRKGFSRPPSWPMLATLAVLVLVCLVMSTRLHNPAPRHLELTLAILGAILFLFGLYLRYRGRSENRQAGKNAPDPR
jgi:ABC-type enterochelin transport system permease subunit